MRNKNELWFCAAAVVVVVVFVVGAMVTAHDGGRRNACVFAVINQRASSMLYRFLRILFADLCFIDIKIQDTNLCTIFLMIFSPHIPSTEHSVHCIPATISSFGTCANLTLIGSNVSFAAKKNIYRVRECTSDRTCASLIHPKYNIYAENIKISLERDIKINLFSGKICASSWSHRSNINVKCAVRVIRNLKYAQSKLIKYCFCVSIVDDNNEIAIEHTEVATNAVCAMRRRYIVK